MADQRTQAEAEALKRFDDALISVANSMGLDGADILRRVKQVAAEVAATPAHHDPFSHPAPDRTLIPGQKSPAWPEQKAGA
jgi:hypothetical protein